jgi:hypothetical protein
VSRGWRSAALAGAAAALTPAALRLAAALRDPEAETEALRRRLARAAATTAYGQAHGVRGEGDFDRLPVVDADALAPWLARQRAEEGRVLCATPVRFYEPTSGSSGPAKLIPYTAGLQRDLSAMASAWAWDLLCRGPRLRTGRTYLSVSPRLGAAAAHGARPVGTADDAAYLDGWLQALLAPFRVGPTAPRHVDADAFKDAVAVALLRADDLEIVSVWNPTFLEVLLDHLWANRDRLRRQLPAARAARLTGPALDTEALWPGLRVLSCWDQGAAAPMAARLARRFPHAMLQGKGLLATEGPVTVPWLHAGGAVPLPHLTLVELRDEAGALRPVWAGEVGHTYEVVLSTRGGLLRYRLGDRVHITHRYRGVPVLRFVGRAGGVSDLVGEKVNERFVEAVLARVLPPSEGVRTLVPVAGPPAHYALLADHALPPGAADAVDAALREAHHYGLARALGQLGPVRVVVHPDAGRWLTEREVRRGLAWGDIKPRTLLPHAADAALAAALADALKREAA